MNLIWSTDMNKHKTPSKGLQLLVAKKPSVRSLLDLENSLRSARPKGGFFVQDLSETQESASNELGQERDGEHLER